VSEERPGFVLDVVIEGVPSPRSAEAGAVWPRALVEQWSPIELPRASTARAAGIEADPGADADPRRAWQVKDPESDLELTIIWAPGPGDPAEHASEGGEEPEGFSPGPEAAEAAEDAAPEDEGEGDEEGEDEGEDEEPPEGWLLFGHTPRMGSRSEDLLRVCELALRMAERLGLKLFDPILGETFETEDWAFRLTEPFHARGYIATHWVRGDQDRASWVHTHGMDRFGLPDVEAFDVPEDEGDEVVAFLHEAAESWIRQDPPAPSATPRRVDGVKVRVLDGNVGRRRARGYTEDSFEGHESPYVSVVPLGAWSDTLAGWKPSSVRRSPGQVERLCAITNEILPQVRRRFDKGGAAVKVKARFPVATTPRPGHPGFESMWVHVEEWDDERIRGRLANEPEIRSDLACGAAVEIAPGEIWDVLVVQDGRPYRGVSLRRWLRH
jgi:uncharacterized protein YegJ (DUF2314 family)